MFRGNPLRLVASSVGISDSSRFSAIQHLFNKELAEWERQLADKSIFHAAPPGVVFTPIKYRTTTPVDAWLPLRGVQQLHVEIGEHSDPNWLDHLHQDLQSFSVTISSDITRSFWAFQNACIANNIDTHQPNFFANSRIFFGHWFSLLSGIPKESVNRLYIHHPKADIFHDKFPQMVADLLANDDCFVSLVSADKQILSTGHGIFSKRSDLFTPVTEDGCLRLYPRGLPRSFRQEISRSSVLAWRRHPLASLPNSRFRKK